MVKFRVRLRVRIGKPFTTDDASLRLEISGREVVITSQQKDQPLRETTWLILTARGFSTEQDATEFGVQLKGIVELAAMYSRLGADVGEDRPTGWVRQEFARMHGLIQDHQTMAPNIHGLIVIPDDDSVVFPLVNIHGKVTADPRQIVGAMEEIGRCIPLSTLDFSGSLRLFGSALMTAQPLAQLALAISAVETLGQSGKWTETQKKLLESLANDAESSGESADIEVGQAIRKGVHRIGLRQGVLRVLARLGLDRHKKEWDRIYGLRSGLFHGTALLSEQEIAQLSLDAVSLAGLVIIEEARSRGLPVPSVAAVQFSL